MPDNTGSQGSVDARELWRQWSDTNTRIWEGVLNGAKASYTDPYGLYQIWFKTMNDFQEQMQAQVKETSAIASQATEAWKQWFDTTTQFWSNAANSMKEAQTNQQSMYLAWLKSLSTFQEQVRASYSNLPNPSAAWQQWMESVTKIWNDASGTTNPAAMAPYALYQAWLKSVTELQEQMKITPLAMPDAKEAWSRWFEYTAAAWRKAAEMGADPLGLTTQWFEMLEETKAKLQTSGIFPADPFTLYKQWYDATSETWARVTEEVIGTEQFMDGARRFLDSYASFSRTLRRANEEYFHNLQLPTRSDIARVASLVVALEDKVDKFEDTFEDFADNSQQSEALQHIDTRLQVVEDKTNAIQATIAQLDTTATLANLDKRLTQVESKLDRFLSLLEKIESKVGTDKMVEPRRRASKAPSEAASNGFASEAAPSEQM